MAQSDPIDTSFLQDFSKRDNELGFLDDLIDVSNRKAEYVASYRKMLGNAISMAREAIESGQDQDYDYASAIEYMNKTGESLYDIPSGRWASRRPDTGQLLKSPEHETANLMYLGEIEAGNRIVRKGNREFSHKIHDLTDEQKLKYKQQIESGQAVTNLTGDGWRKPQAGQAHNQDRMDNARRAGMLAAKTYIIPQFEELMERATANNSDIVSEAKKGFASGFFKATTGVTAWFLDDFLGKSFFVDDLGFDIEQVNEWAESFKALNEAANMEIRQEGFVGETAEMVAQSLPATAAGIGGALVGGAVGGPAGAMFGASTLSGLVGGAMGASAAQTRMDLYEHEVNAFLELNGLEPKFTVSTEEREKAINQHAAFEAGFEALGNALGFGVIGKGLSKLSKTNRGKQFLSKSGRGALIGDMSDAFARQASRAGLRGNTLKMTPAFLANIATEGTTETLTEYFQTGSFAEIDPTAWETMDLAGAFGSGVLLSVIMSGPMTGAAAAVDRMGTDKRRKQLEASLGISKSTQKTKSEFWQETYTDTVEGLKADTPEGRQQTLNGWTEAEADAEAQIADLDKRVNAALADGETTTAADLANQLQRKKAELEAIQINIAVTQEVMVGQDGARPSVRKMTSQEVIDSDNARLERNEDGSIKEPNQKKVVNNENLNKHEQRAQDDLQATDPELEVVWYEGTDTPAFFRPETPKTVYLQRTNRSHHTALYALGMHEGGVHRVQYFDPVLYKALRDALGDGEILLNAQLYIGSLEAQDGPSLDKIGGALIHHLMQGKSLESFDIQTAEAAQIYLEQEGVAVAVEQAMKGVYGGTFGNILRRVGIGTKAGKATARFLNILQQSARAKATEVGGRFEVTGDLGQRREEERRKALIQGGQAAQEAEALFDRTETLTPEEAAELFPDTLEAREIVKVAKKRGSIAPPPKIETVEELWAAPQQKITSEKTDLGTTAEDSTYLPRLFKNKLLDKVGLHFGVAYPESGMVNANLASGKSNAVSRSFDEFGVTNYNYDPFLRDASENKEFVKKVGGGKADTATISNALNVIKESGARAQLIAQAANVIKEEGTAFFTVYEGDGTGTGKVTRSGYQTNRKLKSYIPEVEQYFETVQMRYGVIAATNPRMEARNLWTKTKQNAAVKAAKTLVLNQVAPTEYLRGLAKNEEAFEKAGLLPLDFIDTEKVRAFKIPAIDAGYVLVKEDLFTYKIVGAYNNEASVTAVMDTFVNHAKTLIDEGSLSLDGVKQEAVINQEIEDGVEVISLAEVRLLAEEETEASTPAEVAKLLSAVDLLPTTRYYDLEKQLDEMENEVPELRKAKEEVDELRLHKDSFANHAKKTGLKSDKETAENTKKQWDKAKKKLDDLRDPENKNYAYTKEMDSVFAEMIDLESEMYDKIGLNIPERGRKQRHRGTVLRERLDIRSQAILGKVKRKHKDKFIEEVMARAMVEELLWANAHGNWDASTWYASSIDRMWDAVELLEPDLRKDSDHGIVLTLMLALQSNGEKVDRNLKLSLKAYRYWKRKGKFPPKSGQYRDVDFDKLQMLHNYFGSWKKLDKWLRQERLFGETKKEVKEMVENNPDIFPPEKVYKPSGGLKSAWDLDEYLVKEMTWNAYVLGPKLGAFYLNNGGEFNPITQDLWFARTFYRLQGMQKNELLTKEVNSMKRLSEEISKVKESDWGTDAVAGFHPDMLNDIESLNSWVEETGKEYARKNFKEKNPTKKKFYTIVNGWYKLVKEDKKAVATSTERGQAIRVVKEAVRIMKEEHGIELNNASAQAMLWYFEKELYANMSSETTPFGQDFGTIADDLVKQEHFLKNRVDPTMAARSLNLVRDSRFGVGKRVGNNTYIEISYLGVLPQDAVDGVNRIKEEYDEDFKVVKYNTKTGDVSLIVSPEFDTVQEPKIEASVKYTKSTDTVGDRRAGSTVYHHKWLMVEDDYTGFDVEDSMVRTEVINKEIDRLSLSRNQIGSSKVWSTVLESLGSKPMEARRIESKVGPATYYPKLASILESLRQPKMPPDQLRKYLVGKGVSKQEMIWTGLDEFLDASTGSVLIEDAIQAVKPLKLHHVELNAFAEWDEENTDASGEEFVLRFDDEFNQEIDGYDIEIAAGKTIPAGAQYHTYVPPYYDERKDIYGYSEHIIQWDATEFDLGVIETTQVRNNYWQTSRSQFLYTLVRHMTALNYSFSGGVWSEFDRTLELVEQAAADASVQFEEESREIKAEDIAFYLPRVPRGINSKAHDFAWAYIQLFYERGTDWVKPLRDMKATNDRGVGPLKAYGKTQDTLIQEFATVIKNQMGKRLAKPSFLSASTRQEAEAGGYTYEPHSSSTGRVFIAYQQLMMGKEESVLEVTDALKKHTGLYYHAVRNNASPMDYIPTSGRNPLDRAFNFILRFADVSEAELLNQYSAKVKDAVGSAYQVVEESSGFTRHHWKGIDNALAHTRTFTMSVPRPDGYPTHAYDESGEITGLLPAAIKELQVIEAQSDWANKAVSSPVMRNPWTLGEVNEVSKLHPDILTDAGNVPTAELNEAELRVRKTLDTVTSLSFDVDVVQLTPSKRFQDIEALHPAHLPTTLDVLNKLFLNRFYTLKASAKTEYARNSHPNHIESTSIDVADLLDSSFFNTPETTFSESMLKELDYDPSKPYLFFNKDGETSVAYRLIEKGVFDFEYWTETDESGLYPVVQIKLTDLGKRFFDEIQNSYAYKAFLMSRHERKNTIPAGPFVIGDNLKADDAWHGLVIKQMIAQAVEQGADSLFWADLEFVNTAAGIEKSDDTSYAQQANILKKIAKKVDRDAKFTRVFGEKEPIPPLSQTTGGVKSPSGWRLEITDKIRESVREGMPMFGNTAMNARRDIGLKIAKTNASLRQSKDPMHWGLADAFDLIPIQDYFDNGNDQFLKGFWEVEIEPLVSEYVHALDRTFSQNYFKSEESKSNDPITQLLYQIAGIEYTPNLEVPDSVWSTVAELFPEPENKESTPIEVLLKLTRVLRLLDSMVDGIRVGGFPYKPMEDSVITFTDPKNTMDLLAGVSAAKKEGKSSVVRETPIDEQGDETSSVLMNVLAKLIYAYPLGFGYDNLDLPDSTVNRKNPTGENLLNKDALDTAVDRLNRERPYLAESDKEYLISVYDRVHPIPQRRRLLMPSLPYDKYQPVQQEIEGREPFIMDAPARGAWNLESVVDEGERASLEEFLGFNLNNLPKDTRLDTIHVSSWDNRSEQSKIALIARTGKSGNYTSKVLALNPAGTWIPAQSFEHKHKTAKEGVEYAINFLKDRWFPVARESAEAMSFVEVLKSDTEMRARKLGSRRRRTSIVDSPALGMMMRDEEEQAALSPVQRDPFRAGFRAGARSLRKLRNQQEKEERKHAVETAKSKARAREARKLEAQRKRLENKLERVKAKALEAEKLRDTAIALVNLLPVKLRGKLATRLARVTTAHRLGKLAERAVQLAAQHEYRESVVRLRHVKRRLKKRKLGMSNQVREDINKKIREAERAAYQTGSTRMLPAKGEKLKAQDAYEISEIVNGLVDEAIVIAKEASIEYRASKEAKAERLGGAAFALIESLIKGKPRPLSRRGKRFNRKSKRWFRNTKTTITLVEELTQFASPEDAALIADILHHDLTNGESLSLLEMKRIFEEADRLARNAGYKSFTHLLDVSGATGYGAVTETYNVVLGGEEITVTLGELLKLYALDPETVDAVVTELDSDGNVVKKGVGLQFEEGRTVHPILNVTRQELLKATGQLTPQHKDMIHGLKSAREQLRDVAFKAYYDIHGTEPRFVEGYEPRSREQSAKRAEASLEVSSMTASFIDEAGYTKERTGGGQAIMVGNFVNDFISSSENLSKLAHMAIPARNAISLINQREVKDAINTFLGADFHKDVENRLMHGAGMVQRQRDVFGIIGGNIARAYLTLNKQTWLRVLVGGVANLTIKLSPSDMLFGLASLGSVRRNLNEAWSGSGYLWARSLSGAMRRYTQETEQTAGRIADTASIMRSLEKIGKSLARAITEVSHGKISNAKEYVVDIAKEIYGLPDTVHVMQLCDNLVTAVAYGAFRAKYARAGLTGGELIAAASKATESVIRTTQNTSSGLDATVLDANDAVGGKEWRALFPFVSDPVTKANTVYTAIRYGTMKQKAIAAQGFVLANAINAGVTFAFGTLVALVIKSLTSDEEDERTREMLSLLAEAEQIKLENRVRSNLIQGLLDQLGYAGVATGWLMGAFEGYGVDLPQLAAGEFDNLARSLAGIVAEMTKEDTDWDKVEQHMWDASETLRIALGDPTVMPQRLAERIERGTTPASKVLERSKRTIEKQTPLDFLFNQEPRKLKKRESNLIKILKRQEEMEQEE